MKKRLMFFCMVLISVNIFAAEKGKQDSTVEQKTVMQQLEFNITPAIGLSASVLPRNDGYGSETINYSIAQFDLGFNATMIGMPVADINANKWKVIKGLTTIINFDIGLGGKISVGSFSVTSEKAMTFYLQALEGYTFKPIKNFYVTPAIGLGFGNAMFGRWVYSTFTFSIPIYASAKYFFTDLIGIDVTVLNSLGFDLISDGSGRFINTFILKVGPVFRLGSK